MAELARGSVFDRPWGRTLATLGLRGLSGQLALSADGKTYEIAFANGVVVGAWSPLASDAAVRVALTGGLVSTTQVAELARKQAAAPRRDEVDLIAEHLRLGADQALRLRRRTIAQRAARSFSVDKGEFVVTDAITLPVVAGSELDVRTIIYLGAKQNLSESRLATELGVFGTWFRLKPEAFEDLPQFGFTDEDKPILEHLMNGASLGDLEAIAGVDARAARAAVYALCAANACNVEQTRGEGATRPPPMTKGSDPGVRRTTPPPAARTRTPSQQPIVAYRPGMRTPGKSQPPQNTTSTLRANVPTAAPASARTTTRAQTSPGIGRDATPIPTRATTPPTDARSATPTGTPATARVATATSTPATARTSTPTSTPATARTTTPTSTPVARITPTSMPAQRAPTSPPQDAPRAGSGSQSGVARAGSGSQSGVARAGSGSQSGVARPGTGSNPGVARPGSASSSGVVSSRAYASIPPTNKKLPGADEVKQLIDVRAALIEQGANHYALLGVGQQATAEEIRKSYFNLARQLHPDRLAAVGIADENHVAHKVFAQLNTAFSILSDAKRRAEYDDVLGRGGESALREEQAKAEAMATRILQSEEAFKRGEMAMRRDDYATAMAEFGKAIEGNPDEPDFVALHAWAVFCAAPDKNTVARQTRATLEKAMQRSPRAINPRFYLGRVLRMLGHDREALDIFKDVLFDKPHHSEAQSEVRAIEARLATSPPPKGGGLFGRKR